MQTTFSNTCTRCGKDRIDGKTWTEEVEMFFGTSTVTHTETMCPDPECQKIVEEKLAAQKKQSEVLFQERENRLHKAQEARRNKRKNLKV